MLETGLAVGQFPIYLWLGYLLEKPNGARASPLGCGSRSEGQPTPERPMRPQSKGSTWHCEDLPDLVKSEKPQQHKLEQLAQAQPKKRFREAQQMKSRGWLFLSMEGVHVLMQCLLKNTQATK